MTFLLAYLLIIQGNQSSLNWERIYIDESLSVELPENHQVIDTLGQVVYLAETDYSIITLSSVLESSLPSGESIPSNSIEELNKFYDGFEKGTTNSKNGRITESERIVLDSLVARTFRADYPNGETILNQLVVVRDRIYFAATRFNTENLDHARSESSRYFSSFQLNVDPNKQLKNQSTDHSIAYKVGYFIGKSIGYLVIPLVIVIVVVILRKVRKKRVE
ncbi:hypothetical protein [Roseivirga misakiensis]|uniref:Uncharacterized protein n=1 Tax=Roseivirga misakiensis TaxID=1563681 RepID=A0A1E5T0R9_9BACT|nr:hypothetical protein [Roseivirga misakiensis]OEK04945.1 hypothetical protein BFP71_16055 [Roseivirga misakiensis]